MLEKEGMVSSIIMNMCVCGRGVARHDADSSPTSRVSSFGLTNDKWPLERKQRLEKLKHPSRSGKKEGEAVISDRPCGCLF